MSAASSISSSISRLADPTSTQKTPQVQTGESNPFAEVSSEEWLGIILEELSNQDPFEPNDTSATLEQLNSLRSIESDLSLQDQLESLVLQNSIGQAGSLIGKQVEGLSNTGLNVAGTVASVRVVDGKSLLQLENGSSIEFANVSNVANPTPATTQSAAATTTDAAATADANTQAINDALAGLLSGNATASENPEDQEVESTL